MTSDDLKPTVCALARLLPITSIWVSAALSPVKAVVRAVAEAHGGATLLEQAPGGGAVLGLRLPLGQAPQLLRGAESGWRHAGRETAEPAAAASGS